MNRRVENPRIVDNRWVRGLDLFTVDVHNSLSQYIRNKYPKLMKTIIENNNNTWLVNTTPQPRKQKVVYYHIDGCSKLYDYEMNRINSGEYISNRITQTRLEALGLIKQVKMEMDNANTQQ